MTNPFAEAVPRPIDQISTTCTVAFSNTPLRAKIEPAICESVFSVPSRFSTTESLTHLLPRRGDASAVDTLIDQESMGTTMSKPRLVVAVLALSLAACGSSASDDHEGETPVELAIDPGDTTLTIEPGVAGVQLYAATATWEDGSTSDVSDRVAWSVADREVGRFDGAEFITATDQGGYTLVRAALEDTTASTSVTVVLRARHTDPSADDLPDDPGGLFGGEEDPGRAPELVYPADGVIVPPNLGKLEIHLLPGAGNTVFEISFQSQTTDVLVYTTCVTPMNGGCIYEPDPAVWFWIAESNRGRQAIDVSVRATDDGGTGVGVSAPIQVAFSYDDIRGGIYYWTTSVVDDDETAIMRFDFASTTQTEPELFIDTEMTAGNCVGCHALAPAGDKLITATDGSYGGMVLLLDVASRTPIVPYDSTPRSAFSSWNLDGTEYVGTYADEAETGWLSYDLNVFDGASGASHYTIPVGGTEASPVAHPDWSSDGDHIVFTRYGVGVDLDVGTTVRGNEAAIELVERTGGTTWSAPISLTTSETAVNTYYPTFSPEGDLIAFNRSECTNGVNSTECDVYDDPSATLFVIPPEAGATPIELAAANAGGVLDADPVQNSFPKWTPFTFRLEEEEINNRLHWITFSSNRRYGLRTIPAGHTLIWMAAVQPDHALGGADPSAPALALPFQDLATDNHTAQWAREVVGGVE